jgi:hypothetical protein
MTPIAANDANCRKWRQLPEVVLILHGHLSIAGNDVLCTDTYQLPGMTSIAGNGVNYRK